MLISNICSSGDFPPIELNNFASLVGLCENVIPVKGVVATLATVFLTLAWLFSGQPLNVTVQVKYTDGTPVKSAAVIATDYLSGQTYTATTDADGIAKLSIPNFDLKWYGMTITQDGFPSEYDVNHDGKIDGKDIGYFAKKYGAAATAIGSIRVIVPPNYDEKKDVTTTTYPDQIIIFSDVPAPPSTPTPTTTATTAFPAWLSIIFTPPTLYLLFAAITAIIAIAIFMHIGQRKPTYS
jgi:hypothetical protein